MKTFITFPLLLLTILFRTIPVCAKGDSVVLTLDNAVTLALEKSYDARSYRLNLLRAEQDVNAAKGRFKTNVNLSLESPNFQEQVQDIRVPDEVPQFNTIGTLRWRSQLVISQPLPTDGRINLQSNLYQVRESVFRDQSDITVKNKRFYSSFRLDFRQPLFVPNTLKLRMERANLDHEQARHEFTRTQLEVVYRVTEDFYSLYSSTRRVEIAREAVEQQEQLYKLARQKYEAGLIPEVEALQMEVDLAQSRNTLLESEGILSRMADQFKLTVGLPIDEEVTVKTDFLVKAFPVEEEKAIKHGLRYRSEVRQREIVKRLAEITLRETDARSAIRGEIGAYYDLTGVSDPYLAYSASINRLVRSSFSDLQHRPHNRGVQFTLSVPLWDAGVNNAEVASAQTVLQRSELDIQENERTVIQQIRSVIIRFREAIARLDALKRSEEVAMRGYQISLARFDNGDITSIELALNRNRLTQAHQDYLNAYIQYQLAVADLKRQTLYDFEHDRSLISDNK